MFGAYVPFDEYYVYVLLVLKGIYHYWTYFLVFRGGLQQMQKIFAVPPNLLSLLGVGYIRFALLGMFLLLSFFSFVVLFIFTGGLQNTVSFLLPKSRDVRAQDFIPWWVNSELTGSAWWLWFLRGVAQSKANRALDLFLGVPSISIEKLCRDPGVPSISISISISKNRSLQRSGSFWKAQ